MLAPFADALADARAQDAVDLAAYTPQEVVAYLARALHREGFDDHIFGHITFRQADGTVLVNPFNYAWDELAPGDVVRIDMDGAIVDGSLPVTPAIRLHLELQRARPEIEVAIHHHSRWATIWAATGRIPPPYDQTSSLIGSDRIALVEEYVGNVGQDDSVRRNVELFGQADAALLANHGLLVVAPTVELGYIRAVALEWRCRQAWHVETLMNGPGRPMPPDRARELYEGIESRGGAAGALAAAFRKER